MTELWTAPAGVVRTCGRGALTALLSVSLVLPGGVMAQPSTSAGHSHSVKKQGKLSKQERVLHALNRFTFGPRPGDEAALSRMGLDAWFEQQLHPERVPDAALEARLAQFPAMQLPQAELIENFPNPERLRQYSRGALGTPGDAVESAIYADAAFGYEEKKLAKAANQPRQVNGLPSAGPMTASVPSATAQLGEQTALPPMETPAMDGPSIEALLALPPEARMERLVAMSPQAMQFLRAAAKGREQEQIFAGLTAVQREEVAAMQAPVRVVGEEALASRLLRDVYSDRQLQAVMTDFWLNHFNVYVRKDQNEPYLLPAYERDTILPHALGRFEDLLVATAESPAMLVYLDNWTSIGPDSRAAGRLSRVAEQRPNAPLGKIAAKMPKGINENYARELMELHTLGVNGGYTQQDVIEVAKCFTGWTISPPAQGGEFTFNPNRHEPGSKTVLGHVIPEGGQDEGLAVLHILASSPATAHFLSLELAQRFVSDTPPPALVDRMAAAYLKSDGDIATVLRTMFHSREFWSPAVYRAKVKTPMEFVASALRASGAEVSNPQPLLQALDRLGMPVYGMQTPNGYSWEADAWTSSSELLNRMNFALTFSGNRLPGVRTDWAGQPGSAVPPPESVTEAQLEELLLHRPAAPQTRAAVLAEAENPGAVAAAQQDFRAKPLAGGSPAGVNRGGWTPVKALRAPSAQWPGTQTAIMAGLLLGSPDFQRR